MRLVGIGLVLAASAASAEPVAPAKLPAIALPTGHGQGEPTAVYAAGVDPDILLAALRTGDFAMVAGGTPIDGKLGDGEPVTGATAFDALATSGTVRLHGRSAGGIDLDLRAAGTLEVLRLLADTAGASYVFAPQHVLPKLTVRARHVDVKDTAKVVAKLAGLELIERGHAWLVVEPGTAIDGKLAGKADRKTRLEIEHAHPGEARRLLDPSVGQDRNLCPKDTWIDASLHGETGALEAVLATLKGPACEQHPDPNELDTATAQLVGILVGPKARRAVFRVPHGARAFEPSGGDQRVEVDYVVIRAGDTQPLHATAPIQGSVYVAPGPFEGDVGAWQLRGTVRVGSTWRAIFKSKTEWRIVGAPTEITAGAARAIVGGKPRGYTLER